MNREIKFRGRLKSSKDWHCGYVLYNYNKSKAQIMQALVLDNADFPIQCFDVDVDTIGQFTGLHDKNGKEIYEGDILQFYPGALFVVEYIGASFKLSRPISFNSLELNSSIIRDWKLEIVGNIFDNRELVEE